MLPLLEFRWIGRRARMRGSCELAQADLGIQRMSRRLEVYSPPNSYPSRSKKKGGLDLLHAEQVIMVSLLGGATPALNNQASHMRGLGRPLWKHSRRLCPTRASSPLSRKTLGLRPPADRRSRFSKVFFWHSTCN
jgi:hypothetical protein